MWYIVLIALALLIFFGEEVAGGFLNAVAVFLKYFLPIGSVLLAIQRFLERKLFACIGWIVASVFWAWFFGWFR